ncbi:D-alanyl-D-alanine carboxypeptidase [Streptomyces sp. CB02261]|uniref:D-alanyl-D-alanine carboxypeptidase n=1 Tax=Streptomyces sp. CB02261 TaxID=1703940 RepID=UPI00093E084F|nr:serine hydrolase [Streptomyces sp. CB02261]OKJ57446.1 D-alanyl-D-alanine carboxypeptidase [Streptomyces sp. CB02261]
MAGESPDRAEQQGPSQETTASGGGGRDPRLSVLRESDASSAASVAESAASSSSSTASSSGSSASSSSASSVQVDQPTAVFKNLVPRTPEDDAPAAAEPEPESERLKAAVAAWVATAEDPAESDDPKAPEGSEADESDSDPDSDPDPDPDSDAASVDGEDDPEADSADDEPADDELEGDVPEGDEIDDDEPVDGEPEDDEPAGSASADAKASGESWFAARNATADEKPSEPTASAADPQDVDGDDADEASEPEHEPVDQPTTMFKAVRPPVAPPVDQPTTALKLPPSFGADSDSERSSTFVPLRADIPAEQKAQEAPEAPAAAKAAKAAPKAAPVPAPAAARTPSPAPAPAPAPNPALAEAERTRQQPLPPLPPLDLLAELTNTPPPPPTPLRTTVRRVRIWTPLVLLLLIVFAIAQMVRPLPAPALTLSAAPTFTFEGGRLQMPWPTEGQGAVEVEGVGSMGTYGAQKPAPIASVTKTMTAYVILRDHPIKGAQKGPEITIDKKAADQGKAEHESTAAVQEGQTYSEKELLQLLMIPSANNVARLLARWDAGSEAAFVEKMNAAAKDLGMTQSTYTDPSGLLDSTVSTPKDQLKLAKAVMQYDVFREIVNTPNVTIDGIPGRIENNNKILLLPGVSGIKTGSSTPAGGNLLWAANTVVDGKIRRILGIVMGAKNADQLGEKLQLSIDYSYELIKKAQDDVTSAAVVRKGQVLGYVDDGLGGRTPVVATKELKAIGWPGLKVKLELTDGGKALPHAGKAGDVVGQVSIGTGAGKVSAPVALKADLVEPGFDKKLTRVG